MEIFVSITFNVKRKKIEIKVKIITSKLIRNWMRRQSQKQPLKSLINAILQFTENSESNFPERAKELPWEMLLMDLSNNQNGGINLEAIKDENWFRFDEWSFPGAISQDIDLMASKQRNSRKFS